jgi:hypothetical protein
MSLSSRVTSLEEDARSEMASWGDAALFWACLAIAAAFVVLALLPPRYRLLKMGAICWAVLP